MTTPKHTKGKAKEKFGTLRGKRVAVLGLTFKPGTDDLREAPSISNVRTLLEEGASIIAYDPVGKENFKKKFPIEIEYAKSPEEALDNADMVFIFTEWQEIKAIPLEKYSQLMKKAIIFDGRNCYSIKDIEGKNIEYHSIGRKSVYNIQK